MKTENQQRIAQSIFQAVAGYKRSHDLQLTLIPESKPSDTVIIEEKPEITYRIWFDDFRNPKDPQHRKFRGMPEVWYFFDGRKYQYTYGKGSSLSEIVKLLNRLRDEGNIRRKYLKDVKILEFEEGKLISDPALLRD